MAAASQGPGSDDQAGQGRQPQDVAARVVPEKFYGEAHHAVEHCVEEYDLAAEALAPVQPDEKEENEQSAE